MHRTIGSGFAAYVLIAASTSCSSTPSQSRHDETRTSGGTASNGGSAASGGTSSTAAGTEGSGGSTQPAGGTGGNGASGGSDAAGGAAFEPGVWVNATANLGEMMSVCGNTYRIWSPPNQDKVLAAVVRVGVYASTDGGLSWALEGGSTSPNHDHNGICFDPEQPDVYWVAGMHIGPGVFKTTDAGASFAALGEISNIDDVSVDFTDPDRKTLLAGAHEQHLLYKSTDGGASFANITASFPSGSAYMSAPLVIDANTYVVGTAFGGADPALGVFQTTDGGDSWTQVSAEGVSGSGLKTSWGPLFYGALSGGILRGSSDGSTWTGVPVTGKKGYSIVIELPGNRIATTVRVNNVESVVMSSDEGATWTTVADAIPQPSWWNTGIGPFIAFDSVRSAFFSSFYDCGDVVHADSIWRYDVTLPE